MIPAREVLVRVLNTQYGSIHVTEAVSSNLKKLENSTTFTVTTGHQLNIFTGPLYFIFKIITVINTCRKLKEVYPDHDFVPVFWMASEDHDIDEIRSFSLFGNSYSWETSQTGPVGRMDPSSLSDLIDQLPEDIPLFRKAYTGFNRLSDSVRYYVNELFGRYGLVVIDADQKELKELFSDVIKDDLFEHHANKLVEKASSRLTGLGYDAQVFPRSINLFYMENHLRGRIIRENDQFKVTDSDLSFSGNEIKEMIERSPEKFSPNVILRPLYQECILPNVAYIGGPAEVAYWLQLKDVFHHYKLHLPILMPRNFGMVIGKTLNKKMKKLQISSKDLFRDINGLKNLYLEKHAENSISLENEKKVMDEILESIKNKTKGLTRALKDSLKQKKRRFRRNLKIWRRGLKRQRKKSMKRVSGRLKI
jgi:bacillithiol synthase